MKEIMKIVCCFAALAASGVASAHLYGKAVPLSTSTGYNQYFFEWHADDPWGSARPDKGDTNWGPWRQFPEPTVFALPVEGQIGPVTLNKWYRATFYHKYSSLITKKSSAVFIAADICGGGPPTHTR
jgi:hypothetical protein